MYQQKFMPYNHMNDVYEDDEFQQEDSEPLVQEVDPDYEPTQKQVRQYAIQILGMKLPEDERLIYLAREGLKAPIPTNWQPFQGRDGEVYYKHKITQEKTFEHPTDIEYRKKYIQEKERAARKNLKSMSLKANLSVLGQPLGAQNLGGLGQKGINPLGLGNLSESTHNFSKQVSKLDPRLEEQFQEELEDLQEKLKRQFEDFEEERRIQHQKNMKKYKSEFETSLSEMTSQKSSIFSYEKFIKEEKQRIKQRLKEAYDDRFKIEFSDIQKQEQKKFQEFVELYEEDNKIKLKKHQTEKEKEFIDKVRKLQNDEKKHEENKRQKEKQREKIISKIRERYQQQDNEEIQQATRETFQKELQAIKDANALKVRQVEQRLENEFAQMKKLLGHDPNQALQEMAQKKNRLKKMAEQKIESLKKKEYQKVSQQFSQHLDKQLKQVQIQTESQNARQIERQKVQNQQKLNDMKRKLEEQTKQTLNKKVQQIYSELKRSTTEYETQKNKKILEIRQKFISQIVQKNNFKTQELNIRVGVREKEEMLENKEELIQSLTRQIQLQSFILKELRMNKAIAISNNVDDELKRIMIDLKIVYKPEEFLKHEKRFNEMRQKYKSDKQLLGSMMGKLQNSSYLNFYDRQSEGATVTSALVKQYNKDVRTMRKNEEMLGKYEVALRRAELNDEEAIKQLKSEEFTYEDISIRLSAGFGNSFNEPHLQDINNSEEGSADAKMPLPSYAISNSYESIQDKLKSHSKFLSTVKAELNRKLYKVRSNNYFRV